MTLDDKALMILRYEVEQAERELGYSHEARLRQEEVVADAKDELEFCCEDCRRAELAVERTRATLHDYVAAHPLHD